MVRATRGWPATTWRNGRVSLCHVPIRLEIAIEYSHGNSRNSARSDPKSLENVSHACVSYGSAYNTSNVAFVSPQNTHGTHVL